MVKENGSPGHRKHYAHSVMLRIDCKIVRKIVDKELL